MFVTFLQLVGGGLIGLGVYFFKNDAGYNKMFSETVKGMRNMTHDECLLTTVDYNLFIGLLSERFWMGIRNLL